MKEDFYSLLFLCSIKNVINIVPLYSILLQIFHINFSYFLICYYILLGFFLCICKYHLLKGHCGLLPQPAYQLCLVIWRLIVASYNLVCCGPNFVTARLKGMQKSPMHIPASSFFFTTVWLDAGTTGMCQMKHK